MIELPKKNLNFGHCTYLSDPIERLIESMVVMNIVGHSSSRFGRELTRIVKPPTERVFPIKYG